MRDDGETRVSHRPHLPQSNVAPYRCDVRPVIWGLSEDQPAFSLPAGAQIEVTDAEPGIATEIITALSARGFAARKVAQPSGRNSTAILTEGLTRLPPADRHWAVLDAARAARNAGGVVIVLQQADTYSGLEGLSRTLRKEWTDTQAYAWTLPYPDADLVTYALMSGYGDGALTPEGALVQPEAGNAIAPPETYDPQGSGIWLVTGGARGVTADCAIELARRVGGTILLAGRSAIAPWPGDLPITDDLKTLRGLLVQRSRNSGERITPAEIDKTARGLLAGAEIRETLATIQGAGAQATYITLDAGDSTAVSATLADVQKKYGPITGWIHGGGVLADKLAMDKTEAELRRVFSPKVDGLMNILGAVDTSQLRHIAFFSSAAAFFGNKGQSDYAMANALLASARRSLAQDLPSARVKVFHWGPWAGGMVDAALAGHFEAQGIPLIPVDEGARIFADALLGGDPDQVELIVGEAWASS